MTSYPFGAVVLVAFPFTDQSTTKQRPAVVISSSAYQRERIDLIILAITSQVRVSHTFAEAIIDDWQAAGLIKPRLSNRSSLPSTPASCARPSAPSQQTINTGSRPSSPASSG